jgi:septal ring factor EnvC (AmiA/AmiB activator)
MSNFDSSNHSIAQRLYKVDKKIDDLNHALQSIVTNQSTFFSSMTNSQENIQKDLAYHIKRTDLLEQQLHIIDDFRKEFRTVVGIVKFVLTSSAAVSLLYALLRMMRP